MLTFRIMLSGGILHKEVLRVISISLGLIDSCLKSCDPTVIALEQKS